MLNNLEKPNAPIFIVGTPRSGTTLIARILGNHSHIFMPGETHFFDDIYARRKELGNPQEPDAMRRIITRVSSLYQRYNEPLDQERFETLLSRPAVLNDLWTTCKTYQDILSFLMDIQMAYAGKVRWGNNVPKDIFSIKEIVSFYPDVKILVCIRDVRDFLLSYQNKWKITSLKNIDRLKKLYHPILTALLWKASMRQLRLVKSYIKSENFMIIKYESLVKNPSDVVRDICTFINVEFEERILEVNTHNSSYQIQENGIFSSSVGGWRGELAPEEAYLAQKITSRELRELGYTLENIRVSPLRLARIITTFPYALWRALDANRGNRGPLIAYLIRRVVPFLR